MEDTGEMTEHVKRETNVRSDKERLISSYSWTENSDRRPGAGQRGDTVDRRERATEKEKCKDEKKRRGAE